MNAILNLILALVPASIRAFFGAKQDALVVQAKAAGASGEQVVVAAQDASFVARANAAREHAVTVEQRALEADDRRAPAGDRSDAHGVRPDVALDDPFQRD